MKSLSFSSVLLSIVLSALTIIALTLLIPAYQGSQRALLEEINLSHAQNQRVLQQFFNRYLQTTAFNIEQISQRSSLKQHLSNNDNLKLKAFLNQLLAGKTGENIHAFAVTTQTGETLEIFNTSLLGMEIDLTSLAQEFIPDRTWQIQSTSDSLQLQQHLIRISFPIISDNFGEVVGTLHAFVLLNNNFKLLSQIQGLTGSTAIGMFYQNTLISGLSLNPILTRVLTEHDPSTPFNTYESDSIIHQHLLNVNRSSRLNIRITIPNSSLLALQLAYTKDLGVALIAVLALGLITVLLIARLTKNSLVKLVDYAEDMAIHQKPEPFTPGRFTEFNRLGHTLEHMVSRISVHETQLNGIISNTPNIIFIKGADLKYQMVSPNYQKLTRIPVEDVIGRTDHELYDPTHADSLKNSDLKVITSKQPLQIEYSGKTEDGRRNYLSTKFPLIDERGAVYAIGGIVTDVTDLKNAQSHIQLAGQIFDQADEAILVLDTALNVVSSNSACHQLAESTGESLEVFSKKLVSEQLSIRRSLSKAKRWQGETLIRKQDGSFFPAWLSASSIITEDNSRRYVLIFSDISAQREAESKVAKLSNFDNLTGLPNRSLFFDRLESAISRAGRNETKIALLFINIDRFKNINDTYGHAAGDELLIATANRIADQVRPDDTVSRLGGDEFGVILQNINHLDTVNHISHKVLEKLRAPYELDIFSSTAPVSIGIALFPDDGRDSKALLSNADTAMYHMKEKGRNGILYFDQEIDRKAAAQTKLEEDLRLALLNQEIFLMYQPRFHINGEEVLSAEALARWQHPEQGFIPPDRFISLAEQTGLIVELGRYILETACYAAKSWNNNPNKEVPVSVNLSARQIYDPNLLDDIAQALSKSGLPANLLELEITETLAIDNLDNVIDKLSAIRDMGVKFSVDDFGTGYSSLIYLKRLPVSTVKIDRSFVMDVPGDVDDEKIISAIISMSHSLQLDVVAEGVETQEQLQFLREHKCDEIQGYLLGKPDSADKIAEHIRHYSSVVG